ncbi:MAG: amidohydrolase family protein [Piscinibacter sp.]|nr:amidohydrolase family protein [Piscinibacter sp.]
MIVDCHCHAGHGDGLTGPWDTEAPISRYLQRCARAGIGRSVVFAAFHSDYRRANAEVATLVASRPDRLLGFAFVHAERDRLRMRDLVREAVEVHGFVGLKVHRHDARITREVIEAAREFGLPVLYDIAGESASVELFASQYRDVNFIVPHLGSFADDWAAQLAFIDQLQRHPNVYTDSAGVRRFDLLEQALARAGAHKLLFGSDGPWLHPEVELHKLRLLGLSAAQQQQVLGGNLLRLIARVRRPRARRRRLGLVA